jgi:HPt (histidine-containing phosphotransfer) domain-containing protein
MINRAEFNETFQYFDKEVVVDVIDIFLNEEPVRLENLRKNIEEQEYDMLESNIHSLKGVISNFRAPRMFELTREMELLVRSRTEDGLMTKFGELKAASQELIQDLLEIRRELVNSEPVL